MNTAFVCAGFVRRRYAEIVRRQTNGEFVWVFYGGITRGLIECVGAGGGLFALTTGRP